MLRHFIYRQTIEHQRHTAQENSRTSRRDSGPATRKSRQLHGLQSRRTARTVLPARRRKLGHRFVAAAPGMARICRNPARRNGQHPARRGDDPLPIPSPSRSHDRLVKSTISRTYALHLIARPARHLVRPAAPCLSARRRIENPWPRTGARRGAIHHLCRYTLSAPRDSP